MKKNKIEKIIFTGQALRVNWPAILWIYELIRYSVSTVSDLKFYCTISADKKEMFPEEIYIPYDIKKIYNAYGFDFSYKENADDVSKKWSEIYYNTKYNKKAYDYIYSVFKNSLVISFEIEDVVSSALSYFDIPHIDMNLDPIRFLPDLMLCFKTKIKDVYGEILKYRVPEEFLYMHANYFKDIYYQESESRSVGNNVLFLGQTSIDKTVVNPKTGKIYTILEHKKEFEKSVSGYDNILYKSHPYVNREFEKKVVEYLKSVNNLKIIDGNFYRLCSRPDIKKVVSISSGTCSEAKYFGKTTQNLLREGVPRQTEDKFDENKYVSIYGDFFSLNFWSDILSPLIKTKKYDKLI